MFAAVRDRLSARHAGLLGLCGLAFVYMALFRYDLYGVEEAAARALLINWSIIHQVASPVALFGVPDLRGFLFVLLDLHWAGSLIAAKVFTMLILFATILGLYRWAEQHIGSEAAMMVCGLLPILPISIMQTDAIGGGIYVLSAMLIIAWLNEKVKDSPFDVPGLMFLLAVLLTFVVSIHPAGLGAVLVLVWMWLRQNDEASRKKRRNVLIAIAIALLIPFLLRAGWPDATGYSGDFLPFVGSILAGPEMLAVSDTTRYGMGLMFSILLVIVLLLAVWLRRMDTLGWFMALGVVVGLWHCNEVWLFFAAATLLYIGMPLLLQLNSRIGWNGIAGKRGLVLLTVFIIATVAMGTDRQYRTIEQTHLMTLPDQLIATLADDAAQSQNTFLAASEWPARTMMACKRDVLPLPIVREGEDAQQFLQRIDGVTHFLFDPRKEANLPLARLFSELNASYETIELNDRGVLLKAR